MEMEESIHRYSAVRLLLDVTIRWRSCFGERLSSREIMGIAPALIRWQLFLREVGNTRSNEMRLIFYCIAFLCFTIWLVAENPRINQ